MPEVDLPAVYSLQRCRHVEDLRTEVARAARAGAEEGLMFWAERPERVRARLGRAWYPGAGNLLCAVLLRPDFASERDPQLSLVATLGAGLAIAELCAPMTALHLRWPNDVLLNGAKAAGLWLDRGRSAGGRWFAMTLAVNVAEHPRRLAQPATDLHAQQAPGVTPGSLLTRYGRYLLAWLNRWDGEGLDPVLAAWRIHLDRRPHRWRVTRAAPPLAGRARDLDAAGDLQLDGPTGEQRRVSLAAFAGLR